MSSNSQHCEYITDFEPDVKSFVPHLDAPLTTKELIDMMEVSGYLDSQSSSEHILSHHQPEVPAAC